MALHSRNMAIALALIVGTVCCSTSVSTSQDRPIGGADDPFEWMTGERIGEFHVGMSEEELRTATSCSFVREAERKCEVTGESIASWRSSDCGVELTMAADEPGGEKHVRDVALTLAGTRHTARGIGVGSREERVAAVYADSIDHESSDPGRTIVAGSVYGGLVFEIEGGVVRRIFLGAAAE